MIAARQWRIGERVVDLSQRGMIMGVLNVTPDSFSDGGRFVGLDSAVARGIAMAREGADIIDIGGESTRPGAEPVNSDEELRRVLPVIEKLRDKIDIPISIDTSKPRVAEAALKAGAAIVNDVTAARDPEMLPLIRQRKCACILMHMQGEPRTMQVAPHYHDVVAEVGEFFLQQYERALDCGIDPMGVAFDPGIGFGKTLTHNLELLRNLGRLRIADRPLAVGVSRKSFLGKLTEAPDVTDRLAPTIALTALLRGRGADIMRVHDVKENLAALRAAEALRP